MKNSVIVLVVGIILLFLITTGLIATIFINNDSFLPTTKNLEEKEVFFENFEEITSKPLVKQPILTNISCVPYKLGYDNTRFRFNPPKHSCFTNKQDSFFFDKNQVKATCGDLSVPEIIQGYEKSAEKLGKFEMTFNQTLGSPEDYKNIEYFYMKCGTNKGLALVRNVYNKKAADKAYDTAFELSKKHNIKKAKPLTVLVLLIDSASRQSFYRNLQETVRFFNESLVGHKYSKDYVIYDFLFNNAIEGITLYNIIPIFFGQSYQSAKETLLNKTVDEKKDAVFFEKFEEKAL